MSPPTSPPAPAPSFAFLAYHDPWLPALGAQAERLFAADPAACLGKLRLFGDILARTAAARLGVYVAPRESHAALLARLGDRGAVSGLTAQLFRDLYGAATADHREALHQLEMARELAVWFERAFGSHRRFDPGPFIPPPGPAQADEVLAAELDALRGEIGGRAPRAAAALEAIEAEARLRMSAEQLAAHREERARIEEALAHEAEAGRAGEIAALRAGRDDALLATQAEAEQADPAELQRAVDRAARAAQALYLREAAVRHVVDRQLREAGWEADTRTLTYRAGARPEAGKNRAIAGWPTKSGEADYALFVGLDLMGFVDARKVNVDVADAVAQADRFSQNVLLDRKAQLAGGPWGDGHQVPFLFATNGRPFASRADRRGGVWLRDLRRPREVARALDGWYSPEGLAALLAQDAEAADAALRGEAFEGPGLRLRLRDDQVRAVQAVERAIGEGRRTCLVAMAPGTGKTRVALELAARALTAQRFRRVLVLVDGSALSEQAVEALAAMRLGEGGVDVATVQGMARRVLDPEPGDARVGVDAYDCVIADECLRGVARRVMDHFDAVRVGLTATPAKDTVEAFGKPVFSYAWREAVADGSVVDHEPVVRMVSALAQEGVVWQRSEAASGETGDVAEVADAVGAADAVDEVEMEVDAFNRLMVTEGVCRVVCAELAEHVDPRGAGKTIVFCVDEGHADTVARGLRRAFARRYGDVEEGAVVAITGRGDEAEAAAAIRRMRTERWPSVVATVDVGAWGIDVPAVCNVVLLRRVRQRGLFEQMLGRGARVWPEGGKRRFRVFDAVGLCDAMEGASAM